MVELKDDNMILLKMRNRNISLNGCVSNKVIIAVNNWTTNKYPIHSNKYYTNRHLLWETSRNVRLGKIYLNLCEHRISTY